MNKPRPNMAESVLARAELFRRGLMFQGVPSFTPDLQLPVAAAGGVPGNASELEPAAPSQSQPAVAVPGATDQLVAGAVSGEPVVQTLLDPGP